MKNQPHNSNKSDDTGLAKGMKRGLIAVAALAALTAVYAGYWNYLAGQVRDGIEQWAADRRAEGYGAEYAAIAVGGFPFWLDAEISAPALTAPGRDQPWSWRGPTMVLKARPWAWNRVQVLVPGRHRVTAMAGGKRRQYDIEAGMAAMTLWFRRGLAVRAGLSLSGVAVSSGTAGIVGSLDAAVITVERPPEAPSSPSLSVGIEAKVINLPQEPVAGLGRTTKRLILAAAVKGDLPKTLDSAALARWRDNGGTLDVSHLDIRHGPLDLTGDGTGALDADMQPIGAFTLSVRGFNEALDRLAAAGIIKPNAAALVKTVLDMMARGGDGKSDTGPDTEADTETGPDSMPQLKVSLSVQDGKLYIGPVAVAEVPVVRWPQVRE